MENGIHALYIAFAVFIFVFALAISLTSLSQAKSTADTVLYYSDRETFQEHISPDLEEPNDGGRTVGVDTVISTLSRAIHENFVVTIIDNSESQVFDYTVNTKESLKTSINNFIKENLESNNRFNKKYRETYAEITLNGQTYLADDGTKLEENVGKRLYITYVADD